MAAGDGVLVALGESCLEYIAHTDGYPKPDTRNFSTHSHIGGGGKAANAAVAFNRLATGRGISTRLITRVGRDPAGRSVLDGLRAEGIELPLEHLAEGSPDSVTGSSIVVVAKSTRTLVHSAGVTADEPLGQEDVADEARWLIGGRTPVLLYLDGRHPAAALQAAQYARARSVPILVEADAVPYTKAEDTEPLLALADYIITTAEWPRQLTGLDDVEGGLAFVLQRTAPHARMAIATLENCKQGCLALNRPLEDSGGPIGGMIGTGAPAAADGGWPAQVSSTPPSSPARRWNDPANYAPQAVASPGGVQFSPARKAAYNPSRQHGYTELPSGIGWAEIGGDLSRWGQLNLPDYASVVEHKSSGCLVVRCPLPPEALAAAHANMRDPSASTSAFIGGFMTAMVAKPPLAVGSALRLSCDVAGRSWAGDGRSGLPTASAVPSQLLYPGVGVGGG